MKSKNNIRSGCVNSNSTDCTLWSGPDIPCIGIEAGMNVTEVEKAIACKVCDLADSLDVSELDLTCLIEQTTTDPDNRDVKLILQLLLDNQCSLKELIDAIDQDGGGSVELNLNLKCLKKFDEFENEIPQDLNQTLQSIVNQVCASKDDITALQAQADDLQDQIDNLPPPPDPFEEPVISTCVTVAKPVSESVILLSSDYCAHKNAVGTTAQIQASLAKQCENLNSELGAETGWNLAPQNLAQTISNMWITICNLRNRIRAMETTCCAPSCDKIKLGFTADFDLDNAEVSLNFISGAGTLIPSGFEDCGSVLTITDKNGISLEYQSLDISQGSTIGPLSLSGLAAGTLNFNIKSKFCLIDTDDSVILTCQDCINKDLDYAGGACCSIRNIGSAPVTIIYTVPVTTGDNT